MSHLGDLARLARDAVLEQRPDVWHRVTDLIEAALAVEVTDIAAPDELLVRRLRGAK